MACPSTSEPEQACAENPSSSTHPNPILVYTDLSQIPPEPSTNSMLVVEEPRQPCIIIDIINAEDEPGSSECPLQGAKDSEQLSHLVVADNPAPSSLDSSEDDIPLSSFLSPG